MTLSAEACSGGGGKKNQESFVTLRSRDTGPELPTSVFSYEREKGLLIFVMCS